MQPGEPSPPEEIRARVRRFAELRAAQRAVCDVAPADSLRQALDAGRALLQRLRAVDAGDGLDAAGRDAALREVDALLSELGGLVREALAATPVQAVVDAVSPLADSDPRAVRALAVVALEGKLESEHTLGVLELLATLLCCEGPPGRRVVVRQPLEALPELGRLDVPALYEAHPDVDQAEQVLGRALRRIEVDDRGATRDRVRSYKRRLGARILHPTVLAATVAYNAEMANRYHQLVDEQRALDAFARALLGSTDEARGPSAVPGIRRASPSGAAVHSKLFWQTVGSLGLATGLLALALLLWPHSAVEVLAATSSAEISPHLAAGYVSGDDGTPRFFGTLAQSWDGLAPADRRRVVARIAARLEGQGVRSVTLVDGRRTLQARHEDEKLLWLRAPPPQMP